MSETTSSLDKAAAELEKLRQEGRKTAAEALQAEVAAYTPELPKDLPGGTWTVPPGTASPAGALSAFYSLDNTCKTIKERHVPPGAVSVWIVPFGYYARCAAFYQHVEPQLSRLKSNLEEALGWMKTPGEEAQQDGASDGSQEATISQSVQHFVIPAAAVVKGISLVGSALPMLASLMKTTTTTTTGTLSVSFTALSASMAGAYLRSGSKTSGAKSPGGPSVAVAGHVAVHPSASRLLTLLGELMEMRDTLALSLARFKVQAISQADADDLVATEKIALIKEMASNVKVDDLGGMLERIEQVVSPIADKRLQMRQFAQVTSNVEAVIKDVDAFMKEMNIAGPDGQSPLSLACEYEQRQSSHVLQIEMSYAGIGSDWVDHRFAKDKGHHLGATVVSFLCVAPDGSIVSGGAMEGYRSVTTTIGKAGIDSAD